MVRFCGLLLRDDAGKQEQDAAEEYGIVMGSPEAETSWLWASFDEHQYGIPSAAFSLFFI
jgi:hypothetical protein